MILRKRQFWTVFLTASLAACNSPRLDKADMATTTAAFWYTSLDGLKQKADSLERALSAGDLKQAQAIFREARLAYKRAEFLWEFAYPLQAARLNHPAIEEVERDCEHTVNSPQGLQWLEAALFSEPVDSSAKQGRNAGISDSAYAFLQTALASVRAFLPDSNLKIETAADLTDSSLFGAMRMELFRLAFLGSTDFDSPLAKQGRRETMAALQGMEEALSKSFHLPSSLPNAESKQAWLDFLGRSRDATGFLKTRLEDMNFDHADYLLTCMNPLYAALTDLQVSLAIPFDQEIRAYAPRARGLFDAGAWDLRHFAPPFAHEANSEQVLLGKTLFFDASLSGNGTRSCATCHQPQRVFSDGLPKSPGFNGHGTVRRNAPTLWFAAFQQGVFADLRAESLEDQADMVVHNPEEMNGDLPAASERFNRDSILANRFLEAFAEDKTGRDRERPATPQRIRRALAAYQRTLVGFESPWDRFARGDRDALSPQARRGFNLYMGKGGCANCHFAPLFNGTLPPRYERTEIEVLGIPAQPMKSRQGRFIADALDADSGRMAVDHAAPSFRGFKTPTLRNVALTAPYMHNGVFATLEEVMDFYDVGGGVGLGLDVPNQTLAPDSLHLSGEEKRDLIAFLHALTDTTWR